MDLRNFNQPKIRRAFIFPILVGVMAFAMAVTSVIMTSLVAKLATYGRGSICGLRANYAASAAVDSLAYDRHFNAVTSSAACTGGTYIVPNTGTCALPGIVGTITTMDSSCSYSAQLVTKSTGTININAIGRCVTDECGGSNGAIVEFNANVKNVVCSPGCDGIHCNASDGCGGTCGCTAPKNCVLGICT